MMLQKFANGAGPLRAVNCLIDCVGYVDDWLSLQHAPMTCSQLHRFYSDRSAKDCQSIS
jgi:hypothetical protein